MVRKKKILFVCTNWSAGMIPFASKIVNTMAQSGDQLELFGLFVCKNGFSYRSSIDESLQNENFVFIEASHNFVFSLLEKIYPFKILKHISNICNNKDIDLIHFLTTEFSLGYHIHRIQKKIKTIYTVHDLVPHEEKNFNLKNLFISEIVKRGVAKNIEKSKILSTSSLEQYRMLSILFPRKLVFFHPFPTLVTKQIIEGNSSCPELSKIDCYILFFGRVDYYKGVELLYNTFINNEEIEKNYYLVIAGIGDWYFKRNLDREKKIIRINRYIAENEVKDLFIRSSCVVYPYLSATQSGVLCFPYYFGKPVVTSNIPFFLENIEPNKSAFVFENENPESINAAIKNALNSTMNYSLISECQQSKYNTIYSEQALIKAISAIYETLMDEDI